MAPADVCESRDDAATKDGTTTDVVWRCREDATGMRTEETSTELSGRAGDINARDEDTAASIEDKDGSVKVLSVVVG